MYFYLFCSSKVTKCAILPFTMEPVKKLPSKLTEAGLSPKASLVYSCLLELGGAYPSHIANVTNLNRSTVYKILTDLSIKGLVNEIERGKKIYYQIENPKKLLRLAERQAAQATDALESVNRLIPELQGYFAVHDNRPRVLYFEGADSVLSIYDDTIAGGVPYELLSIANIPNVLDFLDESYYKRFRKRKVDLGITVRGILPINEKSLKELEDMYTDVPPRFRPKIRYLPESDFAFQGEIMIYGDSKVAVTNLDARHLSGVIIEDRGLHLMMRTVFELAWKGAKASPK